MKKTLRVLTITTISMLIFTSGVVYANPVKKQIKAVLNKSMKFQLNGNAVTLKDSNGNKVYPIEYDKKIYVPVNSIGDMLKTPVVVDSKNNKVSIGERQDKSVLDLKVESGNDVYAPAVKTTDSNRLTFQCSSGNVTFKKGIVFDISDYVIGKDLTIYLNKKYKKLSFSAICNVDSIGLSVRNGDTNIEIKNEKVGKDDVTKFDDIDVGGINKLVICPSQDNVKITIGDPIVK